jgi:transaldolase
VKIPATKEGIPAIRRMIAEGRNTNITLIFSIERYEEVIEAYLGGLEELLEAGGDLSAVSSVASFFVSRVDTEADRRLERLAEERGGPEAEAALGLRGRAAVAQARLAYERFEERFSRTRWERLAGRGGRLQRPLWASTSTKNPAYPDLAYVETLIGENTVNTMPEPTLKAFEDHGKVERTVTDYAEARTVVTGLSEVGVELADVARTLEEEGVAAFEKSFDEVRDRLSNKAAQLGH